jgi:hypothetical protein
MITMCSVEPGHTLSAATGPEFPFRILSLKKKKKKNEEKNISAVD